MKNILILSPTSRERRHLPRLAQSLGANLIFDDFDNFYFDQFFAPGPHPPPLDIVGLIEATINKYKDSRPRAVTSAVGYPGMSASAVIAKRLSLPGPNPEAVMLLEHKYLSRVEQRRIVPEATPEFCLLDPRSQDFDGSHLSFPLFLKPVKSCFSVNAYAVNSADELRMRAGSTLLPDGFTRPFNDMVHAYTGLGMGCEFLIAESLLKGHQVSVEGYVFKGRVSILGIVDALMFPGTRSFRRFQYPSALSEGVQQRMADICRRLLSGIGYGDALFNVEMIYDEDADRISIIEVNPKIASQFPDLFEKVDGTSSYSVMLQIALGETPVFSRRQGRFKVAASCVLRTFEDQMVVAVPPPDDIAAVQRRFPDVLVEVHATAGSRLSAQMQDAQSFRYGLINIGADSLDELEEKLTVCQQYLHFDFLKVSEGVPVGAILSVENV